MEKVKVYNCILGNCYVYGDKIVIHKCELDKSKKSLKNDPDPFMNGDYKAGEISVINEMIQTIKIGMKKYGSKTKQQ